MVSVECRYRGLGDGGDRGLSRAVEIMVPVERWRSWSRRKDGGDRDLSRVQISWSRREVVVCSCE